MPCFHGAVHACQKYTSSTDMCDLPDCVQCSARPTWPCLLNSEYLLRTGAELQQQEHDLREASAAASSSALAYRELHRQQADSNRVLQNLTERLEDSSQDR